MPARPLQRLAALIVALVVLFPVAATALPIEDYAPYQPQTNCSPNAKPGTLKLSKWLQRKYPGSGSMGISRSCNDGGVSEHKEGRAFDWAVSVQSARDRGYVKAFFAKIFATDAEGNEAALARRMGIMYLIWNDHIYSSYREFESRDYRPCKVLSNCSATMRHRNHVHISLSRRGGLGLTSWYTGATSTTTADGVLDLTSRPYARVTVPADGRVVSPSFKLRAGFTYKITAAGLYGYGSPSQVADTSCVWSSSRRAWTPYPSRASYSANGSLNLLVNGTRHTGSTCDAANHIYAKTITPRVTKRLRLQVANRPGGASGALTVVVSRRSTDVAAALPTYPTLGAAPTATDVRTGFGLLSESVSVPAAGGTVWSGGSLEAGKDYRVTVTGTVGLGRGVTSDGRCINPGTRWYPQASLDRRHPDQDHGNLYVDGVPFTGGPTSGTSTCGVRSHVADITASRSGRVELALWDPLTRDDNTGALTVAVQRLTDVNTPAAAAAETPAKTTVWTQSREWLQVSAASRTGTVSKIRLRKGERIHVVARGTQRSNGTYADASCVRTASGWSTANPALALAQDPLELWVDGQRMTWRSLGRDDGCSSEHAYAATFTATKNGPLRLAVLDLDHRDNVGTLDVTLLRG